ncbi:hypothetical protein [Ralstonia pickettii]|uniref:hypothetical protein n=1 Tax=Ralstonia pickettii TaxID=329 RepID=UPI0029CA4D8A|nr:hypothetical protein [Ralstonia pickettii]
MQQSIIKTLSDRVQLNNQVRGLGQDYRNDISGIVRSGIGGQNPMQVADGLDAYAKQNPQAASSVLEKVVQGFGVPGILAVIITVAVIALAVRDPKAVPEQLWSGLALVLGFYFGSKSKL